MTIIRFILFLFCLLFYSDYCFAQGTCLKVLQANYGGVGDDVAFDVVDAGGGQFYMVGNTNSFGAGGYDILVIKMDVNKNILWSNTYGAVGNETIRKASPSPDGGLLITGQTSSFSNSRGEILCLKIDAAGALLFTRVYGVGSTNGDLGSDIIQTTDGGFAVCGILNAAGDVADGVVMRLDANANLVWSKRFNSGTGEDGSSLIEVGAKLVVTFDLEKLSVNDYGMAVTELQTSTGQLLLTKKIVSSSKGIFRPIIYKDFSNGYWVSGHLIAGGVYDQMEQVILKMNASYVISKTYKLLKNPSTNYFFTGFAPLKTGGFITCASEPLSAGGKGHIYKINADGTVLFSKQVGTSSKLNLNGLILTGNKIITVGSDNTSGSNDFYLADLDTSGINDNLCNSVNSTVTVQDHPFTVSDYVWSSFTDQQFSNTIRTLTKASQAVETNPTCTKDTCLEVVPIIPDFTIPDTVCVNTPVTVTNKTVGANSNYWNFCVAGLNNAPTGVNLGNIGGKFSSPVFMDYAYDAGNYYGFVTNYNPGGLTRLDFGNSLLNTPIATSLGNFNGALPEGDGTEGIQIIKNKGNWYAIILGGNTTTQSASRIIKIEFGASLSNPSPVATNWGDIGNMDQPIDLHVFNEGGNWYGFTVNAENNSITRFNFTNSFNNIPTASNLGNLGNLAYPTGIYAINDNGFWRVFILNGGNRYQDGLNSSLTRLDFGNSLLNNPTAVNLGNPGNQLKHPRDISIIKSCGEIVAFVVNASIGSNEIIKLDFENGLAKVPSAFNLSNTGDLNFPHSISKLFRVNNDLFAFITNVANNTITRLSFAGCSNTAVPNSFMKDPPPVTYKNPGTYNINLTIDDGLPTQSSVCKTVVVMPAPVIDFSYTADDCNPFNISFVGSDSNGNIKWDFGDGTIVTGQRTLTHLFSKSGLYKMGFYNNGFCPAEISKSITINININDIIKNKDTVICENGMVQMKADSALSYCWSPSTYLNHTNTSNPIAKPLKDTRYTLVSKTAGNNLVVNGDFANGNSGFTSEYGYNNIEMEGRYQVDKSPASYWPNAPLCVDKTGSGNMMLINGASVPGVNVWTQAIKINPGTEYEFSCWVENISRVNVNLCKLQFSINGIQLGSLFRSDSTSCIWKRFYTNWNSGNITTATISIVNQSTDKDGNDFALDDISFAPVTYKTDSVLIIINKPSVKTNNDTTVCAGTPIQIHTIGATKYLWSPSVGLNNNAIGDPIATVSDTTSFIVTGTNSFGCIAKDTFVISVLKKPSGTFDFSFKPEICNPLNTQFSSSLNAIAFWNFGDGSPTIQQQNPAHVFNENGVYPVKMWVTQGACQIADTVLKIITLAIIKDGIIGNADTIICEAKSVQLRSAAGGEFCWSPSTYLNNAFIQNPVSTPLKNITYHLTSKEFGNNLIQNGDFNAGNVGFTSAYKYAGNNTTEGEFFVGSNPQFWNANLSNCVDHSNGIGNMMLVNGSPVGDVQIWSQTVNVSSNTSYEFSTWIQALYASNPAKLQFSVNGNVLGETITASLPTCDWLRFNTNWNSGSSTKAVISIVNKNTFIEGNDFALDDISFAPFSYKTDSVTITIDKPFVKATNDTALCAGLSLQLMASGGAAYSWSPAQGLSNSSIANPIATIQDVAIKYTVTGTNSNGCTAKDTVQISVLSAPSVSVTNDTTICGNTKIQLAATGGISYQWSPASGLDNTAINNPIASLLVTTLYKVKVTGSNGCNTTDSVNVQVLPAFTIKVSNDSAICAGSKMQLSAAGGISYLWSPAVTLNNATISNPIASPFFTTKYKVTAVNAAKCTASDSVIISMLPVPVISVSKDTSICKEGAAQLFANGGVSYNWSPSAGLNNNSISNPVAAPGISTVYKVEVTGANTCKATDLVRVDMLPAPVLQLSNDTAICGMGGVSLKVSGAISYLWSPSLGLSDNLSANPFASPTLTTTYQVKATGSNMCTTSGSVIVKVFPPLVATVSNDTAVCGYKTFPLMATGGLKYQWTPAASLNNSNISNPLASPLANTVYFVKITNANNCTAVKTVAVNVLSLPVLSVSNDTVICQQANVQLQASGGIRYQWSPLTGISNSSIANPIASPIVSTIYKVIVTSLNNCLSTDSVSISVRPLPQFGIASSTPSGCAGTAIQLTAFGGDTYQWSPALGLSNAAIANPVANLQSSQTYTVLVSESICKQQASFEVPVTIETLPPLVISKSNDISCNSPFALLNTNIDGVSYLWKPSAGLSNANIPNPIASPSVATTYSVSVLDANGCTNSGSVQVKVLNNNDFRLYQVPNAFTPGTDRKNDCFGIAKWGSTKIIFFQIFNRWGQLVFSGSNSRQCWDGTLKGIPQPSGNFVYKMKVETLCGVVERQGNVVLIR